MVAHTDHTSRFQFIRPFRSLSMSPTKFLVTSSGDIGGTEEIGNVIGNAGKVKDSSLLANAPIQMYRLLKK